MFRKAKNVVGLDIGSSAVKAVELKAAGKGYRVAAFGMQPVPPESIVDGAIIDAGAVADAIRRIFTGNKGFKTKDVCASLSGNAVIVKKITLPVMTPSELDDSISWEAEQVHSLRHPGCQSGLSDSGPGYRTSFPRQHGSAPCRGQEGKDW